MDPRSTRNGVILVSLLTIHTKRASNLNWTLLYDWLIGHQLCPSVCIYVSMYGWAQKGETLPEIR